MPVGAYGSYVHKGFVGRSIIKSVIKVKPKDINFTQGSIRTRFHCGKSIFETLKELDEGTTLVSDIPKIRLLMHRKNNSLWSLDNRRLFTFKRFCPNTDIEVYLIDDPAYVVDDFARKKRAGKGIALISPR